MVNVLAGGVFVLTAEIKVLFRTSCFPVWSCECDTYQTCMQWHICTHRASQLWPMQWSAMMRKIQTPKRWSWSYLWKETTCWASWEHEVSSSPWTRTSFQGHCGIRSYWPLQISRSLALNRSYWPLIIIIFVVFFCSLLQIWYSSCYTGVQDQADSVFDDILWYLIKHNLHFWTVKTFKLTLGNC